MPAFHSSVTVRPYIDGDASPTLAVFRTAVTVTAAADYTPEQIAAWAGVDAGTSPGERSEPGTEVGPGEPNPRDLAAWNQARVRRGTIVAMVGPQVAGFSDVHEEGYIDMLFVDPHFGGQGVASALLREIELRARRSSTTTLSTNASITARPFFERHGFAVIAEQHPVRRGVRLTNFRMTKDLS